MSPSTTLSMLRSAVEGLVVAVDATLGVMDIRRAEAEGIVAQKSPFRNSETQIVLFALCNAWILAVGGHSDARTRPPRLRLDGGIFLALQLTIPHFE
jgi:hypothetical protein